MGNVLFPLSFLFGDGRSYLYPGKNKKDLTPEERRLEELYDRIDRPGNRITPQQFFQSPEAGQLLDQLYGSLTDRIPPGSQIVSQTPGKVTYRDPDGFEHNLIRKPDGQFTSTTNRPAIVPTQASKEQQGFAQQIQGLIQKSLGQPVGLAELDPATRASLDAQSAAEQGAIDQQLNDLQGQLLARLYGNNVNQSSVANEAAARFAQQAGLVKQAQRSDASGRELAIRNLLTTLGQQARTNEQGLLAGLYSNLTGQGTQRDIAGAGLDVDLKRLQEAMRQFDATNVLDKQRAQLERDAFNRSNDAISQISRLVGLGTQVAGAASGGLSAYRALTGGR